MTFTVYADMAEEVSKRLDRLSCKACRYSIPFSYTVGAEHPATVTVYSVDPITSTQYKVASHTVPAVDFDVECEELIKANGWTVRAKVEHGEPGNIVTPIGLKLAQPEWYSAPACCEHCHTNRARTITYFVENAEGEIRQVGRGCLHDYTGINPATAALWAEVRDLFDRGLNCTDTEWRDRGYAQMYSVLDVFAHAYDAIKDFGYRKSDEPNSTREEVTTRVMNGAAPSAEGRVQAEKINAWLLELNQTASPDTVSDLERNCIILTLSGYARTKHFGRLAYMPVAYEWYLERKAQEEQRNAERQAAALASEHVGVVGERITITTATAKLITSWDNAYGTTYLYKFTDKQGNVYIWYASRGIKVQDKMTLKATIKDHNEHDGVKQTVITRCKAA